VVQCAATTVFVAFISMPLLTELVFREDGFCYKHGAPNGALSRRLDITAVPEPVNVALGTIGFWLNGGQGWAV